MEGSTPELNAGSLKRINKEKMEKLLTFSSIIYFVLFKYFKEYITYKFFKGY